MTPPTSLSWSMLTSPYRSPILTLICFCSPFSAKYCILTNLWSGSTTAFKPSLNRLTYSDYASICERLSSCNTACFSASAWSKSFLRFAPLLMLYLSSISWSANLFLYIFKEAWTFSNRLMSLFFSCISFSFSATFCFHVSSSSFSTSHLVW